MSEWISIEDRLPDENIAVLTSNAEGLCQDEREPEIGFYESGHWFWVDRTNFDHYSELSPTHWMPLPKDAATSSNERVKNKPIAPKDIAPIRYENVAIQAVLENLLGACEALFTAPEWKEYGRLSVSGEWSEEDKKLLIDAMLNASAVLSGLPPVLGAEPATDARKLADEIYAWYENSLGRHPDGNDDPSIGAGAMIERFARARAESRLTVDEANELTKSLKAHAGKARAEAKALRAALSKEHFDYVSFVTDPGVVGDGSEEAIWSEHKRYNPDCPVCAALASTPTKEEL